MRNSSNEKGETRGSEWIAEALADLTQAVTEPVIISGLGVLTGEVRRVADELGLIRRLLEGWKGENDELAE